MALSSRLQEFLKRLGANRPNLTDTGFDPDYDIGVNTGIRDLTTRANQLDQESMQDRLNQTRQESLLREGRDETTNRLQETMADRGILRSGATVEQQGKIGLQYQRSIEELARSIADRARSREQEFEGAQNQFQSEFERLRLDRTRRQAERDEQRNREQAELKARKQAAQPVATPTGTFEAPQQFTASYEGEAYDPNDPDALEAILRRLGRV